jgi:hypothetical protein
MKKAFVATLLLIFVDATLHAQSLDLPPRPAGAMGGSAFARSVAGLPLGGREARVVAEVRAGNVPASLRTLVPVTVGAGGVEATYQVMPDYLAVGPDEDPFLVPLSPGAAQEVADALGCTLPTPRMVDDIYAAAASRLTPSPIPPSPAMTTVPVFLEHNARVLDQEREKKTAPGVLVAGHKKDVVIANKAFKMPGKVAIYGWHRAVGDPIQPLYAGHDASWVDYSHGVRLVRRRMTVDGRPTTVDAVLADPKLAPLLSGEGVMSRARYDVGDATRGEAEAREALRLEPGVRAVIDRPDPPTSRPVLLVLYALPNGGTIEQAIGKVTGPGDDWHFDIQHVGAQVRFLRGAIRDREVVAAYLENDLKSWPAWRRQHGDGTIPALLDAVRGRFEETRTRVVLAGHSGGGSLIFGYLNAVDAIPDGVERIAFLDANYAYETGRHRDKLATWLGASDRHSLVVLAYDDASARLDGKPFVSASGGTWGRSHLMLADLGRSFPFDVKDEAAAPGLQRLRALGGRVTFLLKPNPEARIYHTVQVEKNGVIEALFAGTPLEGVGYTYFGDRAYTRFIRAD